MIVQTSKDLYGMSTYHYMMTDESGIYRGIDLYYQKYPAMERVDDD